MWHHPWSQFNVELTMKSLFQNIENVDYYIHKLEFILPLSFHLTQFITEVALAWVSWVPWHSQILKGLDLGTHEILHFLQILMSIATHEIFLFNINSLGSTRLAGIS